MRGQGYFLHLSRDELDEKPLLGMELQEKELQKIKAYRKSV